MRWQLVRERCAPWFFYGLGIFLIRWHHLVIDDLLHARAWSTLLFPQSFALQAFFMGFTILALLPAFGLCLITGWGLGRRSGWARWTGLFPCIFVLFGFPWLTPVGALGLYLLWKQPVENQSVDFWNPRRQSVWYVIVSYLGWSVARLGILPFMPWAQQAGAPVVDERTSIPVFLLLIWIHIGIHEFGHALAAWMVGFRIKAFAIGPLELLKDDRGVHFHFEWRRLLLTGGYTGALPSSAEGIRAKELIVVAGGPFASFAGGAAFVGLFFLVLGTPLAVYWHDLSIGALLGFYLGAVNLVPIGYTDGTMLFHLLFRTRRGEELIARNLEWLRQEKIAGREATLDREGCAALHRESVEEILAQPDADPARLADEYLNLARMEVVSDSWRDAEIHARKSLELLEKTGSDLFRESICWACLHRVYLHWQDSTRAGEVYRRALELNRRVEPVDSSVEGRLKWRLSNAELHVFQHAFVEALEETREGLDQFPNAGSLGLCKARLLINRSHAALQCGQEALGLATADEASAILRTEKSEGQANAFHYLGMLGGCLWEGGCPGRAVILIAEAIRGLEPLNATDLSNRFRLYLAQIHREEGHYAQAACVLPKWERVSEGLRRLYLAERSSIRRKAGRLADALRDASEALRLAGEKGDAIEIALARSDVAEILLENGQPAEAESEARQAYREFTEAGYPDKACVCVTLGLLGASAEYFAEAERIVSELPFLTASARARFRKSMAERIAKCKRGAVVLEVEAVAAVSGNPA